MVIGFGLACYFCETAEIPTSRPDYQAFSNGMSGPAKQWRKHGVWCLCPLRQGRVLQVSCKNKDTPKFCIWVVNKWRTWRSVCFVLVRVLYPKCTSVSVTAGLWSQSLFHMICYLVFWKLFSIVTRLKPCLVYFVLCEKFFVTQHLLVENSKKTPLGNNT